MKNTGLKSMKIVENMTNQEEFSSPQIIQKLATLTENRHKISKFEWGAKGTNQNKKLFNGEDVFKIHNIHYIITILQIGYFIIRLLLPFIWWSRKIRQLQTFYHLFGGLLKLLGKGLSMHLQN